MTLLRVTVALRSGAQFLTPFFVSFVQDLI